MRELLAYLDIVNDKVWALALLHAPEEGNLYPELVVAAYLVLQLHPRWAEGKTYLVNFFFFN